MGGREEGGVPFRDQWRGFMIRVISHSPRSARCRRMLTWSQMVQESVCAELLRKELPKSRFPLSGAFARETRDPPSLLCGDYPFWYDVRS